MTDATGLPQRLQHLADVVQREANHLAQTDLRLFGPGFGQPEAASLQSNVDLAERVDGLRGIGLCCVCCATGWFMSTCQTLRYWPMR